MIEKDNLKIDNYYYFKLIPQAGSAPTTYGRYTGKTTVTSSQYFSEYNIIDKYMREYGMAFRDFYENITDEVEILIVHPLSSLDPPEMEEEPIYIPITLVDFENSDDLLTSNVYEFSIKGVKRYFSLESEKDKYIKEALTRLTKLLNEEELFVSENVSIELSTKEEIKTRNEIIRDNQYRENALINISTARSKVAMINEQQYNEWAKSKKNYEDALKRFEEETVDIENIKQEWTDKFKELDDLNILVEKKDSRMRELYDTLKLYYDQVGMDIPPYDQLISS